NYANFRWDGTRQGLEAFSTIPIGGYPKLFLDEYVPLLCVRRHDFERWYSKWPTSTLVPLERFWPVLRPFPPTTEGKDAQSIENCERNAARPESSHVQRQTNRGRPKGSGTYVHADAPLLEEMWQLIKSGTAFSPEGAARAVAPKASGAGTVESKRDRLAK